MDASDEAILRAIQRSCDPDAEPRRTGSDADSDVDSDEEAARTAAAQAAASDVDPDMARLLEDSAIRRQLGVGGSFTGPKGVANDAKFHRRQEQARAAIQRQALADKWSSQALSSGWLQRQLASERAAAAADGDKLRSLQRGRLEHPEPAANASDSDDDLEGLEDLEDDDEYIQEYRARRMLQLQVQSVRPRFGVVADLQTADYVSAIDDVDPSVTVVIHLYQQSLDACRLVNTFLDTLATAYPTVKFAKIVSTKADAVFTDDVLPAVLVYEAGALTHTLLRITDEIPGWAKTGRVSYTEFEEYLWDMGVLAESTSSLVRNIGKLGL
ncbi:thioredoxin-like protein [Entophlyctis helioformis]|nr:thioredoxin-like protein [Entophlyctis helioformis]